MAKMREEPNWMAQVRVDIGRGYLGIFGDLKGYLGILRDNTIGW
jgi:hypothetical protein